MNREEIKKILPIGNPCCWWTKWNWWTEVRWEMPYQGGRSTFCRAISRGIPWCRGSSSARCWPSACVLLAQGASEGATPVYQPG